ncbi:RDD family protein [Amphibacillus sp. Q70]|uniref:RDD family protein n=1 Tax=Amphibacillus sp. Q70 TaxID=3453416 RepID=UPI003F8351FE
MTVSPVEVTERIFALLIDLFINTIATIMINLIIYYGNAPFSHSFIVILAIFSLLYAIFLPLLWKGYTIGKRLMGIRIAPISERKLTLGTVFTRELLVMNFLYYIGFGVLQLVSVYLISTRGDKRSIHD